MSGRRWWQWSDSYATGQRFLSVPPAYLCPSLSHTLRAAGLSLSAPTSWQPTVDVGDATNHAVISPIPTDGRPCPGSTFNISYPGVSGSGSPSLPQRRVLQESVHRALGSGIVPPDNLSDGSIKSAGGRGRSERRGWRNRLTAAEQYASSILFGRGGNGAGSSGQVLQERDD